MSFRSVGSGKEGQRPGDGPPRWRLPEVCGATPTWPWLVSLGRNQGAQELVSLCLSTPNPGKRRDSASHLWPPLYIFTLVWEYRVIVTQLHIKLSKTTPNKVLQRHLDGPTLCPLKSSCWRREDLLSCSTTHKRCNTLVCLNVVNGNQEDSPKVR